MQGSILVVERDGDIRDLMVNGFRNAGYRVSCAKDFPEAEHCMREHRPDLALLDWSEGGPGLMYARQLRGDQRTADVSIIMLSARNSEHDTVAALESGADDYLAKPFSMRELLARAKAVLRRRAPQLADDVVELGGLRLNPAAQRATAGTRELELRKTEFNLLHYFMTHPQRIHSRRKLLDEVWGDDVFVEERTVDVHVRRLRRSLAPSHDGMIQTVRGVGYRFGVDSETARAPGLYSVFSDLSPLSSLPAQRAPEVTSERRVGIA